MIKILFIGSGAFGSALANAFLSKKNNDVKVFFYAVDPSEYKDILQQKNSRYFGDLKFGRKIDFISLNLAECAAKNPDYIFLACPSKFIGANVHEIVKLIKKPPILINIAKGFGENGTL
jgi:glycerol-3-phosphate dehydrogenase (NAD(P)+)